MVQRYILVDYGEASPATREVYDDYLRTTGSTEVPIWLQSLGHSPDLVRAYWERAKGTLFGGTLPLPLKEMIVFVVSARHGARYCTACHADNVLSLDKNIDFTDLQGFIETAVLDTLPQYYRAVVNFAGKVVESANGVEDSDFEELMDEGFSLSEISEVIAVIDLATMFNVYTSALKLDLDPRYRAIL